MLKNIEVRQYENGSVLFVYVVLEHIKGRYILSGRDEYDWVDRINEIIVIPETSGTMSIRRRSIRRIQFVGGQSIRRMLLFRSLFPYNNCFF